MSKVTVPILLDETGRELVEKLHTHNLLLGLIAGDNLEATNNIEEIRKIVQSGKAAEVFHVGDQIVVPWTDKAAGKIYNVPLDIVHFGNVTLQDGESVPGMYLQWHYCTPFAVQFDGQEAFYYAAEQLPAGTYHITVGANWGTNCKQGETYQFTLTKPVPAGGHLVGFTGMPDQAPANWKVASYTSAESTAAIETVNVTAGAGGTDLGSFVPAGEGNLNSLHRLAYGYNRWAQSGYRQFLNSAADAGAWWTKQNDFDRAPNEHALKAGFLSGFEEDFLKCIQPVKVTTMLNTVTDTGEGESEVTYDKFFLPSLEQMYINPQKTGEGEFWEYWKRASGRTAPMEQYQTYPQIRTYAIENKASAQTVRLRSANRGHATNVWSVTSSGNVNSHYATFAYRCAPACVIC